MAIIVDKQKKRTDIAVACTELLLEKGLKNLRIAEIAKTAGIGKGTVYEYFDNKEALVFEIIRTLMNEHHNILIARSDEKTPCKQKVFYLFDFFLCEYKDYSKQLEVYKEFIAATLSCNDAAMRSFNCECTDFIKDILSHIIQEGIEKEEINPVANTLIDGIIATERGFMLNSWMTSQNNKQELKNYINTLFDLIEIKI